MLMFDKAKADDLRILNWHVALLGDYTNVE
jgi:hypothetical protein